MKKVRRLPWSVKYTILAVLSIIFVSPAAYFAGKPNNHFSTSYKYDIMGNILTLRREGLLDSGDYGTIDDLTYSYEGNQVVKIDDAADESPNYSGAMHFRDAANEETEYTYDANGNMLTDSNKGITSIDYNVQDLPQCINIKPNVLGNSDNKLCYTYSADGTKLRSTYKKGNSQVLPYKPTPSSNIKTNGMVTPTVKTFESNYHYCSNLVYNNDRLSTILFDGGYASVDEGGGIAMHFYVKDHLGSNRLVVDGNGNIEEVNHYYPFGALMGDRCGVSRNKYKYIGKELDTMYGWNMQDHEARWYDPVLGRWMATDPLQEKYASFSTYYYANNNPLVFIDFNGKDGVRIVDEDNKTLTIKADYFVITAAQQYRDNNIINVFKGYSSKDIEKMNSYNEYLNNLKLIVPDGEYKGYSILFDLSFFDAGNVLEASIKASGDIYEGNSIGNTMQLGNEKTHRNLDFQTKYNDDGSTSTVGGATVDNKTIVMNKTGDTKMNRIHEIFHTLGFSHPKGSGGKQGIMKYPPNKPSKLDALELSTILFLPTIKKK